MSNPLDNIIFMDHVRTPKNRGPMKNPDFIGEVENENCGDITRFMLKIKDGIIVNIMFDTTGCAATTASSSMLTIMTKNKTVDEAKKITNDDVANALKVAGMKLHCSKVAMRAFFKALQNYEENMKND